MQTVDKKNKNLLTRVYQYVIDNLTGEKFFKENGEQIK